MLQQRVTILGATGSIGLSTLDVIRRNPARFRLFAMTAATNVDKATAICLEFAPQFAVMANADAAKALRQALQGQCDTQVLSGEPALCEVAAMEPVDLVMAAIVGGAGLLPTMAAVEAGKKVLLANKEALVMSGALFMAAVERHQAQLLPVDSEHNAIFQSLPLEAQQQLGHVKLRELGVSQILLTGSGGPFLETPLAELPAMTPAQACKHPNWSMGQKISVDSATMMNKGLEYIEARWLFNASRDQLQVVIHPQSVIHSMVQYTDGSVLAQMGRPDMRTPIAHAMAYPARIDAGVEPLDFSRLADFSFKNPDFDRFPCLKLAIDACYEGQGATTALNAANEIAVAAFLDNRIAFTRIGEVNQAVLSQFAGAPADSLEAVIDIDRLAREAAMAVLERSRTC